MKGLPQQKTLKKLIAMRDQIRMAQEKYNENILKILEKYGEGTYYYELDEPTEKGEKFAGISLVDNRRKRAEGEPVLVVTYEKDFELTLRNRKTMPKELGE
jgi:hypothetical protein